MERPVIRTETPWLGTAGSQRTPLIAPQSAARWLLLLLAAAGIYLFHDFVVPILAAIVIGFASWPLYRRLVARCGGNRTVAATLALVMVLLFLVVPIALAATYAVGEIGQWLAWAVATNETGAPAPAWIGDIPALGPWLVELWARYVGHPGALGELAEIASGANIANISRAVLATGTGLFEIVLRLIVLLIVLFFVYRDGEAFGAEVDRLGERILPARWGRLSRMVPLTIRATVAGMTLIAIGEGIVLGTAYWIAGVPSPVTLGVITGLMALVPGGAPLAMSLVSAYLVASGSPIAGIALFTWGAVELFVVDKTIRPKLVGGPIKLPFLPTFIGLIGGVKTMGLLGIFVGPVLMAILFAIWRDWVRESDVVLAAEGVGGPTPRGAEERGPAEVAERSG